MGKLTYLTGAKKCTEIRESEKSGSKKESQGNFQKTVFKEWGNRKLMLNTA